VGIPTCPSCGKQGGPYFFTTADGFPTEVESTAELSAAELVGLLEASDSETRKEAISALAKKGNQASVPYLLKRLNDTDEFVRVYAAMALGDLGDPTVIPDLNAARNSVATDIQFHFDDAINQIEERSLPEDERRHRADEAKRRAEEDARRREEEVAKKRCEEQSRRRQEEEKRLAEETRRRQAEEQRHVSVQATRKSSGQCIMCGQPLNLVQKLLGKDRHGGCISFKE
jgi:HEAT repeat protein